MRTHRLSNSQADSYENQGPIGETYRRALHASLQHEADVDNEWIEIVAPEGYGLGAVGPKGA